MARDVGAAGFTVGVRTWAGGVMREAAVCWVEKKADAKEVVFGVFDTRDEGGGGGGSGADGQNGRPLGESTSKRIAFPRAFPRTRRNPAGRCAVICWFSRLDMASGEAAGWPNFRVGARATEVDRHGFTAHVDTWGGTVCYGAGVSWIAVPEGKTGVATGSFGTSEVRSWGAATSRNTGRIEFPRERLTRTTRTSQEAAHESGGGGDEGKDEAATLDGKAKAAPRVFAALNMLDMAGNADLRIRVGIEDVGGDGARWRLDTWDDSTLYAAAASWIALDL